MKIKRKRILAIAALIIILFCLAAMIILSFIGTEASRQWLSVLLFLMIAVPAVIYGWILFLNVMNKRNSDKKDQESDEPGKSM